jgi:CBS domain-containing protein
MREPMNAGDICNRIVVVAGRKMPLREAARLMRDQHVGSLVVVDETAVGRVVVGMLTDRDIVTLVLARELDVDKLLIEDVIGIETVTAAPADSIQDVLTVMKHKGVRRVPVVTPDGVLVGLVTLDDILPVMAEQLRDMASIVESAYRRELRERA